MAALYVQAKDELEEHNSGLDALFAVCMTIVPTCASDKKPPSTATPDCFVPPR